MYLCGGGVGVCKEFKFKVQIKCICVSLTCEEYKAMRIKVKLKYKEIFFIKENEMFKYNTSCQG